MQPAGREGGVGLGELEGVAVGDPQDPRRHLLRQRHLHSHVGGQLQRLAHPGPRLELGEERVHRLLGAGVEVEGPRTGRVADRPAQPVAGIGTVAVLELLVRDQNVLRGVDRRAQRDALVDGLGEDEDLEGRAGLEAVGVAVLLGHHIVEVGLPGGLVLAHRSRLGDGADVPGAGFHHREPADGLVGRKDVGRHGRVGSLLHVEVDRRPDRQPAGLERRTTLLGGVAQHGVLEQPVDDVVAEERGLRLLAAVGCVLDPERLLQRPALEPIGLLLREHTELGHPVQHHVAAALGTLGVVDRVVAERVLHQPGERGRLEEVEVLGVLGEEVSRGRLDAEGAVAEVGDVEVALEDPVLGVVLLEGDRVAQLADLAGVGLLGRGRALLVALRLVEQGLLHHLLRDRRATLDRAAVGLVGDEGAERAPKVERTVVVVAVVLDRDDRLDHRA